MGARGDLHGSKGRPCMGARGDSAWEQGETCMGARGDLHESKAIIMEVGRVSRVNRDRGLCSVPFLGHSGIRQDS